MIILCVGEGGHVLPLLRYVLLWLIDDVGIRSRGGCLTLVPKSPVYTFNAPDGGSTFVSRPSHSTSHPASRWSASFMDLMLATTMNSA